ncbi:MAG: M48 family metalloprotease, partial [Gammaproteobacteria bacterium]|nr:M48 family metalloprotease [Gammaproteobacteria bacterium]
MAAGSSPELAQAALVSSQAAPLQAALAYNRDFEREADRVGFQILEGSGFDVHGMPAFFERMERSTRLYENNAPGYLRTHPLTGDRIAKLLGIDRSNVIRRVVRARTALYEATRDAMQRERRITDSEFHSLAKGLAAIVELTLTPRPHEP